MKRIHLTLFILLVTLYSCNSGTSSASNTDVTVDTTASVSVESQQLNTYSNEPSIYSEIGTTSNYIWESINEEAGIYTTLAFDEGSFRISSYTINGSMNNLTKNIDLDGQWREAGNNLIEGTYRINGLPVSWTIADDFNSLTNNKNVNFKRVRLDRQNTQQEENFSESNPDGIYEYADNSAVITIRVMGDSWRGKTKIISGVGDDYDENNIEYESGIVNGTDLYESSGFVKIGSISGNRLTTTIGGNSITLYKK